MTEHIHGGDPSQWPKHKRTMNTDPNTRPLKCYRCGRVTLCKTLLVTHLRANYDLCPECWRSFEAWLGKMAK